jgi:branched-chain amino acid aminotransferase
MNIGAWKTNLTIKNRHILPYQLSEEVTTLDKASLLIPKGAYTTFRTFENTKVLRFDGHINRLENTARLAGHEFHIDKEWLAKEIASLLISMNGNNSRVRLTIDLELNPGELYIFISPLIVPPQKAYEDGVGALTCEMKRDNPKAKLSGFINDVEDIKSTLSNQFNDVLMLEKNGDILEGLSSNFFCVIDNTLITPNQGVLDGITRQLILEIADRDGVPVQFRSANIAEVSSFQEAFITSSSRGVLPIVQIGRTSIGNGKPGKLTKILSKLYLERIREELTDLCD